MTLNNDPTLAHVVTWSDPVVIPASRYSFEELAALYNQSRVDYIVPMPMNARRMEEYVYSYDIDLETSAVALNGDGEPSGVAMLGLRGSRAWITRLGVIPEKRGRKTGQFLMETLLNNALQRGARRVQLEVIKGNEPARRLFLKLNFVDTRELVVIRRPPGQTRRLFDIPPAVVTPLAAEDMPALLDTLDHEASWVEESRSIQRAGSLQGFRIELDSGQRGWAIFQLKPFQINHVALAVQPAHDPLAARTLLYHLHQQYPRHDTKIENVPANHPHWPVFQEIGYLEAFRRCEMALEL